MKKVLIQVVSVITLVFGTCYQSVLALADDRSRTELSGVQLSDSEGNKLHQVKVNETSELEMTVMVNNKDGENAKGSAAMWLPEDQLEVLKDEVKAESAVADTNATLIYERRKKEQPQLKWKNVETTATFKLKLPVQFKETMTKMILPVALGTQRAYLQPLTVVKENTNEEDMAQAGKATELPANLLQSLTSFIASQEAQQAAQAEAPVKDVAKEDTEDQRQADKKAEQDAEDQKKETAKTEDALKKNSKSVTAESKSDGAEREGEDGDGNQSQGRNLNELLASNTGGDKSLFTLIEIDQNGKITEVKPNTPLDVTDLKDKDFKLVYRWDSISLQEKLKGDIQNKDYYILKIDGLKYTGKEKEGILRDESGQEFAKWEVLESTGDSQEIKIIFTNEKANLTKVDYKLELDQTYTSGDPVEFEQSADAIWTGKPAEVKTLLEKSGQFVNDNQIQWEITLKNEGEIKFSELKLEDVINVNGAEHSFDTDSLEIYYAGDENFDLSRMFNKPDFTVKNKLTLTGKASDASVDPETDIVQHNIKIRIKTNIKGQKGGTFYNQIGGQISDDIRLNNVEAFVTTAELDKKKESYQDGIYTWKSNITLNLDQFKDSDGKLDEDKAIQAIQSMSITDELSGAHEFQADHGLVIMVGEDDDITTSFDVNPNNPDDPDDFPSNKLVITPKADEAKTILEALKANNTRKFTLTYNTKETKKGDLSAIKNKISLQYEGNTQFTEVPGNATGLIVKDGQRSLEVNKDGDLHINWTLTANPGLREFTELRVTDVLPAGVDHDNVKNIKIGDTLYELNGTVVNGVKVEKGWVTSTSPVTGENPYNFTTTKPAEEDKPRAAIQFVIDGKDHSKQKIEIEFETIHEWNQDGTIDKMDNITNHVGAATEEGLYQYTNKTVQIDEELQRGGKKGAKLHLDDKVVDPTKGNNYITWSIDFGGRLNDYFGKGDNQIDTITITDKLNINGPKYLSYPADKEDYTLYHLDSNRANPEVVPRDQYDISWPPSSDNRGHREFTITFNDKAKDKKYTNLRLGFNTRIDFDAWREVKPMPDVPDPYTFVNTADVKYGDRELEDLKGEVEVSSKGLDGQKTVKAGEGNALNWEILFNARGKDIGQPTITDTLSANQRHSIKGIQLAFVTPKFTLNDKGGYTVEADKTMPQYELTLDEDYSIHVDSNQKLTIQLKTDVKRPLVIRYNTIMENSNGPFTNHAEIVADGHSTTYKTEHKLTGSAIMSVWTVRFLKVNGSDNDKPLPEATFKLEERKLGSNDSWRPASRVDTSKAYGEIVSDGQGLIEFEGLGTNLEYRLSEVRPPEKDFSQMEPLEFNQQKAIDSGWIKDTHKIRNHTVLPGNLTLHKATKKIDNPKSFKFEVRAVDASGNVDTSLQGTYKLNNGGTVTFNNGVSDEIKVSADSEVTILELPLQGIVNGQKTDRYYDVRETSTSPDYTTQITVDSDGTEETILGQKTKPFKLDPLASTPVTVYFVNTAAKGDLIVGKTVSSDKKSQLEADYQFTIKAYNDEAKDKVEGKTYQVENGGDDFKELTFTNGEATFKLSHPQVVTIKDLPEKIRFTVTEKAVDGMETTWSVNSGKYTDTEGPITINSDKAQTIQFKNTDTITGQLQVTKRILGNIAADKEFTFNIKMPKDGVYPYTKFRASNQNYVENGTIKITNGEQATFELKGDEYIRITNLPLNSKYEVQEEDPEQGIDTSWKIGTTSGKNEIPATITLDDENELANVTYTNELPHGSLELNKRVLNQLPGDQATEFKFTISDVAGSKGKVANETYAVESNIAGLNKLRFNNEGQATVHMSDKDNVKILGLPVNIHLRVSEDKHPDFNVSHNIDKEDEKEDKDTGDIEILDGEKTAVNYKNTRPDFGKLTLEKRAEGSYPKDESIKFTIDKLNDDELKLEFDAVRTRADDTTATEKVEFSKGSAEVNIKPGEKLEVKGLPEGQYQVSEETQDDVVTTTWDVGHSQGHNEVADPVMVEKGNPANVQFVNDITTGELELNKLVASDDDADKGKTFNFRVRAVNGTRQLVANKTYEATRYSVTEDVITEEIEEITFDSRGRADIGLKDGQTVTISGLPEGVELRVIERDPQGLVASWNVNHQGGYESTDNRNWPSVNITEGQTEVVSYRNVDEKQVGSLRVAKTVEGAFTDDERQFEFQVTSMNDDGFTGEYDVKVYDRNNKLQEKTTAKVVDGTATIKLKADQYAVIDGLPVDADTKYQVSEVYPGAGMTTTWTLTGENPKAGLEADPVTVDETNVPEITFTNTVETGDLTLKKKLSGEITDTDRNQRFDFTVEAQIEDELGEWKIDEAFAGDFLATKTNVDGDQTTSNVTFKDGQLMVPLKGGESLQIHNLPTNLHMVISEAVDGDYEVSHQINQESETPGITTDQIIIESDLSQTVTFINDRPVVPQTAWLSLTKSVLGENGERDREFEFSIRFLDDQMNPLTQTIEYVKTSAIGGIETGQLMLEADGSSTFTLKDGETMRWNVPNGTHYQITESDYTADGYQTGISQGQAPEREGLTATGVAMTNDPVSAKVVYYNRSITPPEEEPHTPEEPDTTDPDFVPPAPESGITTDSSTQTGATPQAHTSDVGTTGSKGFLPQTGEWLAKNWLALLGLVILLSIVGLMAKSQRKND